MRRELAEWAEQAHDFRQGRAVRLIPIDRASLRHEHHVNPQKPCGSAAQAGRQLGYYGYPR
jgi:hypothetical protein